MKLTKSFNKGVEGTKFRDFKAALGDGSTVEEILQLKKEVVDFSKGFGVVGFKMEQMKYK